jgi:hypothetical protein
MDELRPHHQILIEKGSRLFLIGSNAAYPRCQMNNNFRTLTLEKATDIGLAGQVKFVTPRDKDMRAARLAQVSDDMGTKKARASRNNDSFRPKVHTGTLLLATQVGGNACPTGEFGAFVA